ncbi:polysaccharide deacetylase family protein [Clostridium sp.]|uniref:polysaccharide deacetylase family protein n=1 Tax=Clostridium sp. TaxID=1506 RepID=UPI00284954B4|nr:polysaccharide deacetylase family protein [Clostridium sp.]MDR3597818.1 polysaccharide deacetylase family protein [Clostridium sp.]
MGSTNINQTRNKAKRRSKKRKKSNIEIIIKSILCIAVVYITFMICIDKQEKATLNLGLSQEDNQQETPKEMAQQLAKTEKGEFGDVALINDNRGVPVICYHSVVTDKSKKGPIAIPKEIFREQLKTIKDEGYTTLTMAQLNGYLYENKPIPEKSVVVTFDDGYSDNYTNAFPILKEFNMKATIFVISSYVNRDLYLTGDEIKEMSDYGMDIESHTVSHKRLSTMTYEDQLKELKNSKKAIEELTHRTVISIAYPEGKYNNNTKKAVVDAGYAMGFTIERGVANRSDNLAQIQRDCVDYTYKPNSILNLLKKLKK